MPNPGVARPPHRGTLRGPERPEPMLRNLLLSANEMRSFAEHHLAALVTHLLVMIGSAGNRSRLMLATAGLRAAQTTDPRGEWA